MTDSKPASAPTVITIDRVSMVLLDEPVIRDTLAFPKNQAGVDPMTGAPSDVTQEQLRELGIRVPQPE